MKIKKNMETMSNEKIQKKRIKKKIDNNLSISDLRTKVSFVKNKTKRRDYATRLRSAIKKEQSKKRRARKGAESRGEKVIRQTPRTIESTKIENETIVQEDDEEVNEADEVDEFASFFNGDRMPKLLITTCKKPSKNLKLFIKELLIMIPNLFYYRRDNYRIKSIVEFSINKNFTDLLVLSERLNKPCGLYISHLPEGPTSFYKLTNLTLAQDIKGGGAVTDHNPEILLNNFSTRLGRRVARQLASLFPQIPQFNGRRAICFHNQRDFIFFRHHRYIFDKNGKKCRLQEIGPKFTLKLHWMQHGTFDPTGGLYEYKWRPDTQVNRKKMFI